MLSSLGADLTQFVRLFCVVILTNTSVRHRHFKKKGGERKKKEKKKKNGLSVKKDFLDFV